MCINTVLPHLHPQPSSRKRERERERERWTDREAVLNGRFKWLVSSNIFAISVLDVSFNDLFPVMLTYDDQSPACFTMCTCAHKHVCLLCGCVCVCVCVHMWMCVCASIICVCICTVHVFSMQCLNAIGVDVNHMQYIVEPSEYITLDYTVPMSWVVFLSCFL